MALTDPERFAVWADGMRRGVFPQGITKADFRAAINGADDWADANATSFNNALPQPYRGAASTPQKNILLALVCLKRAGIIPGAL